MDCFMQGGGKTSSHFQVKGLPESTHRPVVRMYVSHKAGWSRLRGPGSCVLVEWSAVLYVLGLLG